MIILVQGNATLSVKCLVLCTMLLWVIDSYLTSLFGVCHVSQNKMRMYVWYMRYVIWNWRWCPLFHCRAVLYNTNYLKYGSHQNGLCLGGKLWERKIMQMQRFFNHRAETVRRDCSLMKRKPTFKSSGSWFNITAAQRAASARVR